MTLINDLIEADAKQMTIVEQLIKDRAKVVSNLNKIADRTVELSIKAGLDREISILQAELSTMHTLASDIYYSPLVDNKATGDVPHTLLVRIMEVNQAIVNQMLLCGL